MKKYFFLVLVLLQAFTLYANEESVICLHGFFRSFKCMIPVANTLRHEGLDVYLWDYPSRRKTIEEHAADLVVKLNMIASQNPGKPIHFVTHSLGGVIVRVAVSHPNCPREAKIGKAVLYAPPNQGAVLARKVNGCPAFKWLFGKKAGSQLLTYTEEDMLQIGVFPPSMHVLVIAGEKPSKVSKAWLNEPNDGKVTVNETRLNSPHEHQVLFVSHTWIMTSRESIKITKEFILRDIENNTTDNLSE